MNIKHHRNGSWGFGRHLYHVISAHENKYEKLVYFRSGLWARIDDEYVLHLA